MPPAFGFCYKPIVQQNPVPAQARLWSFIKLKFVEFSTCLTKLYLCACAHRSTQAGAVNGSRARALAARPPNLRRSPSRLLNVSPALLTSPRLFFMSVVQAFLFQARMYHQNAFLKAVSSLRWYISFE